IGGKITPPMHSTGVIPLNRRRSSSTGWGNLGRLFTHRMWSLGSTPSGSRSRSVYSRTNASTLGLEEFSSAYPPSPKTGCRERISIMRLVQCSSRSEEHTSELQSRPHLVCRLLLEKKKKIKCNIIILIKKKKKIKNK